MLTSFTLFFIPMPHGLKASRDMVTRAIDGSRCFGAYLGGRQVGFAKMITDMATFGYLCDVFVLPEFRGRGYAVTLMQFILADDFVVGLRRIVLVTASAHGLYEPFGFAGLNQPGRYMELHRPDIYAADLSGASGPSPDFAVGTSL